MNRSDSYAVPHRSPTIAATEIIFYTAYYHEREARHLAKGCGVSGVLIKPCEPKEILAAIEQALARGPEIGPPPTARENLIGALGSITDEFAKSVGRHFGEQPASRCAHPSKSSTRLGTGFAHATLASLPRSARLAAGLRSAVLAVGARDEGTTRYVATSGMDVEAEGRLGKPEMREGLVGDAFKNRKTYRLSNRHGDPTKVGLPLRHPPVYSALVAPSFRSRTRTAGSA